MSSVQKPGVLKLTKVTSLSHISEEEVQESSEASQSRSRNRNMKRNSGRSFLVTSVDDSVLESSNSSLNTSSFNSSKNQDKKGELGTRGLERLGSRKRKQILKSADVTPLDPAEAEECRRIIDSRSNVGCQCYGGKCLPDTCPCASAGITCQEEEEGSPCCCSENNCRNPEGRYKFDVTKVNLHYVETMMTVQTKLC